MLGAATLLRRGVAGLAAFMAWVAGWNYIACAFFITGDIIGRNAFGVSSAATVEITGYMLACGIAWGLAHTLASRAHIRVDVLVTRLPAAWRAPLHLFSPPRCREGGCAAAHPAAGHTHALGAARRCDGGTGL